MSLRKTFKEKIEQSERIKNYADEEQYPFGADRYKWYREANRIYKEVTGERLPFEEFEKGWQFIVINAETYEQTKKAVLRILTGDY